MMYNGRNGGGALINRCTITKILGKCSNIFIICAHTTWYLFLPKYKYSYLMIFFCFRILDDRSGPC